MMTWSQDGDIRTLEPKEDKTCSVLLLTSFLEIQMTSFLLAFSQRRLGDWAAYMHLLRCLRFSHKNLQELEIRLLGEK